MSKKSKTNNLEEFVNKLEDENAITSKNLKLLQEPPVNEIDMKLIMKTSFEQDKLKNLSEEEKIDKLVKLKTICLDWMNIKKIDKLDVFTQLETLYLQHNIIEKIEGLDMLENLEYLALNSNKIKKIENLEHLENLALLNLEDNQIEDFDEEELPENLIIINMKGNPCTKKPDYYKKILKRIPEIEEIDGQPVTPIMRIRANSNLPLSVVNYDTSDVNEQQNKEETKKKDEKPKNGHEVIDEEDEWISCGSEEEENQEEYDYMIENPFNVSTQSAASTKAASTTSSHQNLRSHVNHQTTKRKLVSYVANRDHEKAIVELKQKKDKLLEKLKETFKKQVKESNMELQARKDLQEKLLKVIQAQTKIQEEK